MSVYTTVTLPETTQWLADYDIGVPLDLEGIASGIENTNYFLTTERGKFVLTIFEKLSCQELSFYLDFVAFLSGKGLPCPGPVPRRGGSYLGIFKGKPACLSICLPGRSVMTPTPEHCAQVGEALAKLHIAGRGFQGKMDNPRGPHWWNRESLRILPILDDERADLLHQELAYQSSLADVGIPRGFIHADLF
ncbi:MAG: phosphotransferase, partial [Pseudomonadota bacterium]|nr:phosphotransferase [Pseudomonadota bacterium]